MKNSTPLVIAGSVVLSVSSVTAGEAADTERTDTRTLLESEDWAVLKNIWQHISKLKPSGGYSDFPISTNKGDSLLAVANGLFADTGLLPLQVRASLNLIRRVTALRLMRLSRINPAIMTRMIAVWTDTVQDQVLFNFETRLALLNSMVENGELTPVEFIAAREVLIEKAEILAVLQLIEESEIQPDYRYSVEYSDRLTTDLLLQQIDLSYSAVLDTLAKYDPGEYTGYYRQAADQYEAFQKDLEQFQRAEPFLRVLLTDLMEAGV